jgi:serine protease AprX
MEAYLMRTHLGQRSIRKLSVAVVVLSLVSPVTPALASKSSDTSSSTNTTTDETTTTVASAQTTLFDVARTIGLVDKKGRSTAEATGRGVIIAMIDTGVVPVAGLKHSKVIYGPDFTPEDMSDDLRSLDTNGHGTHLAGIMVATDAAWASGDKRRTATRTLGIAPDATLVSIKAGAADGGADITQVIAAINWVIAQKTSGETDIDILNLAFSADSKELYFTDPLVYAVERAWRAGIVVVVAGGNEGQDQWQLTSPARDPYVIAVGASELTKKNTSPAAFSSEAVFRPVDIHAPGCSIVSLRNPGSWSDAYNVAGRVGEDLVRGSGTSQASAVVSAAAALLLEMRPNLTPDQVKDVLIQSATTVSTGDASWPLRYLNLAAAITFAPSDRPQFHIPASGDGTIEAVRGELRISLDGVELEGEIDIFGNNWSGSRWTTDSWTGSRWTGSRWTVDMWSGNDWLGSRWTTDSWSGSRWTGSRWTETDWSGSRWTGSRWTGSRWTYANWT